MQIKDLIAKAIAGELDDEGKQTLAAFDPDALAAASRRKAEETATTLKAQIEALTGQLKAKETETLSASELMERRIADLTGKVEQLATAKAEAEKAVKAAHRRDALSKVRASHGINFVKSVDPDIAESAWERAFSDIEDPLNAPDTKSRVEDFKARNAALILDASGMGSGKRETPSPTKGAGGIEARAAEMRRLHLI